jgi:hypothetical protein
MEQSDEITGRRPVSIKDLIDDVIRDQDCGSKRISYSLLGSATDVLAHRGEIPGNVNIVAGAVVAELVNGSEPSPPTASSSLHGDGPGWLVIHAFDRTALARFVGNQVNMDGWVDQRDGFKRILAKKLNFILAQPVTERTSQGHGVRH